MPLLLPLHLLTQLPCRLMLLPPLQLVLLTPPQLLLMLLLPLQLLLLPSKPVAWQKTTFGWFFYLCARPGHIAGSRTSPQTLGSPSAAKNGDRCCRGTPPITAVAITILVVWERQGSGPAL